ncbi:hypothetical protein DTL36_20665 [Bremerella cremea]|nr:hypothetical protein DTL36_20665 [Bremerella cremea]
MVHVAGLFIARLSFRLVTFIGVFGLALLVLGITRLAFFRVGISISGSVLRATAFFLLSDFIGEGFRIVGQTGLFVGERFRLSTPFGPTLNTTLAIQQLLGRLDIRFDSLFFVFDLLVAVFALQQLEQRPQIVLDQGLLIGGAFELSLGKRSGRFFHSRQHAQVTAVANGFT